jgi:hypothetical protein
VCVYVCVCVFVCLCVCVIVFVCVTVNCKVFRSAIALYLSVVMSAVFKWSINAIQSIHTKSNDSNVSIFRLQQ